MRTITGVSTMDDQTPQRKVLIVEDKRTISNLLYVLLVEADCKMEEANRGRQTLALIPREKFDVVMIDLRCDDPSSQPRASAIRELQPSLVGRVLCITGEVANHDTLEWIESNCTCRPQHNNLLNELWIILQALLGMRRVVS
jgi:DNA-binding NtrC family response regulator